MKNLPLKDVIGGVLNSIIDGQNQALANVIEFLDRLVPTGGENGDDDKYITISYDRPRLDDPSKLEKVEMKVPLITLLPIPYLSITEAEIDFDFKIRSTQSGHKSINHKALLPSGTNMSNESPGLSLMGEICSSSRMQSSQKITTNTQVSIKIMMKERDLGEGMHSLIQESEQAIIKIGTPIEIDNADDNGGEDNDRDAN